MKFILKNIKSLLYIFLLLFLIALFLAEKNGSYFNILNFYSYFGSPHLFDDLELLLCGIDNFRSGKNPYETLCYPDAAPFNYPSTWHFLAYLPFFNNQNLYLIGWISIAVFLFCTYFFLGKLSVKEGILYLLFLVSPAALFLFETGNCDLIILDILLIFVVFLPEKFIGIGLSLASILKLFPIGGILVVFNFRNTSFSKKIIYATVFSIPLLIYVIFSVDELLVIKKNTPYILEGMTFGIQKLIENFETKLHFSHVNSNLIIYAGFAILSFGIYVLFRHKLKELKLERGKHGNGWLISIGIFLLSYFLQINWEYRLVFLFMSLPQFFIWCKQFKWIIAVIILEILALYDQSLTMFWNLFLTDKQAIFYLMIRGFRDISTYFLASLFLVMLGQNIWLNLKENKTENRF